MLVTVKQLWMLFSNSYRKQSLLLVILMTVAAVLEMVGIGFLLPVIGLMQKPELVETNRFLSILSEWMGKPTPQIFFIYLLVVLLAFFILKNVFLFLLAKFQFSFVSRVQALLSIKMLSAYLHRPYTFHLEVNTANLIRDVTTEVANVLNQIMIPMVALITECLVVTALFVLIVLIDPAVALFSFCFGGTVIFLFFFILRKRLAKIGIEIQFDSGKMIQYAQEGLGGIKEIKILGRERFFQNAFSKHVLSYTNNVKEVMVFNTIPRLVLDMLVIIIFVGILLILIKLGRTNDALPLMTVYAASAFRLLPGMNRIMGSLNAIKLGGASLAHVVKSLGEKDDYLPIGDNQKKAHSFRSHILVDDVSFRYKGNNTNAIKNISLQINKGDMVGFMGESGSGKTTLIDIILGLLNPVSGQVLVDGHDIRQNMGAWQRQIGYIPQTIYLTDDTLRRNIALGLPDENISDEKVWSALEVAQLANFVRTMHDGLDTIIGERGVRLSGGQRQRIGIARAMYYDPEILVLDEATSALDNETEKKMMQSICALHRIKTILIIAHRTSTLEFCDKTFVINHGTLEVSQCPPNKLNGTSIAKLSDTGYAMKNQ